MTKKITAEDFEKQFGVKPDHDDLHRANCDKAGTIGHFSCGICTEHKKPRFMCCLGLGTSEKPKQEGTVAFDSTLAMKMYNERKAENMGKQVNNNNLPAGSPMYYYCRFCGVHTETLPKSHTSRPNTICRPCHVLHDHGLLS